jgi:hypothetical protein
MLAQVHQVGNGYLFTFGTIRQIRPAPLPDDKVKFTLADNAGSARAAVSNLAVVYEAHGEGN